jgi:hypothetical protein
MMSRAFNETDWSFRWLLVTSDREKVTLARHYEYAREALLRFDPNIKLSSQPGKLATVWYSMGWLQAGYYFGPIFTIWASSVLARIDFPRMSFAAACAKLKAQNRSENLLSYAVEEWALPKPLAKMTSPSPNTGAGAQIRRHKTDLKCLGAIRLLRHLGGKDDGIDAQSRNSGIARKLRSSVVADAMVLSQERLGAPLLFPEQKWELARRRVEATLAGYPLDSIRGVLF